MPDRDNFDSRARIAHLRELRDVAKETSRAAAAHRNELQQAMNAIKRKVVHAEALKSSFPSRKNSSEFDTLTSQLSVLEGQVKTATERATFSRDRMADASRLLEACEAFAKANDLPMPTDIASITAHDPSGFEHPANRWNRR